MWGAGSFPEGVYNKTIPGTYINIKVNNTVTTSATDRGYLACPVELPWGVDNDVMTVTAEDYALNCYQIFGYPLGSPELAFIDEMFKNATVLHLYRLNGGGIKASGDTGTAKYGGAFGNKITVTVTENEDDENYYDVTTYVDGVEMDVQTVSKGTEKTSTTSLGEATDGQDKEEDLNTVTVDFTTAENIVTAKVNNLPEGYEIVPKLTFGSSGAVVAQVPGRIELTTTKDTVTLYLGPAAPFKADYNLIIQVRKDGKTTALKTQTITLSIQEDGKTGGDPEYIKDNEFVVFNRDGVLEPTGGDVYAGGRDATVSASSHEKARAAFESVYKNIIAVPSKEKGIQDGYIEYVKKMRDEYGVKFQIVLPAIPRETPINYEGVIEYINQVSNPIEDAATDLCYWVAGAEAGCPVQSSCTAKVYDGRFDISAKVTISDQKKAIKNGQILFHRVGDDAVILRDLNTLTKITREDEGKKSADFSSNQVVRVFDGIITETANIFNTRFLGRRSNNSLERADLREQLLKVRERYAQLGAIDTYDPSLLTISPGLKPNEVIGTDGIRPLQAMEILYFTITYINE